MKDKKSEIINRDKILEIIKNANRGLTAIEILDKLKGNTVGSAKELKELIDELNLMCSDDIIRTSLKNTYVLNTLITGKVDLHVKGNAHVIIEGSDDILIPINCMKNACDNDIVAIEITNKAKKEGIITKIIKRSLGRSVGEVINDNGKLYVKVLDESLPYEVEVDIDPSLNLVDGLLVHLAYVSDIDKNRVRARIDSIICHKNAPGNTSQIAIIASEFGRRLDFPEDVKEEGKQFKTSLSPEEVEEGLKDGRVDLRGETITTTDGKDTKDIDDAINTIILPNGNYEETVAIADVSHYVKMGSAIWKYAEEKGNSDYLGNKVGPMLPIELSNGICSLNPNEDRFALCVRYELDHAGNRHNPRVFMAVIKSKKKMNYDAVQDIIEGKYTEDTKDYTTIKYTVKDGETIENIAFKYATTPDSLLKYDNEIINKRDDFRSGNEVNIPVRIVVKNYHVTSKIMKDALRRRGKIDFEGSEPKYIFDENDKVIDIRPRVQREAEEIIENKMIYANEAFADFMVDKLSNICEGLIPFVFRTHGDPNPRKIEEFIDMLKAYGVTIPFKIDPENVTSRDISNLLEIVRDKENFRAFSDKLLRCMQKARYTPENYGHFGIASDNYCHFTSPIRRMADLLVHTIYKVFIKEENHDPATLKYWADYLNNICEQISECEVQAEKCEYAVNDYLNATYLQDKIGTQYEATVDGLMNDGFFAKTDNFIDGRVDFFLEDADAKKLLEITDPNEAALFIEQNKRVFSGFYNYNDKMFGYERNGRMYLRYGDRVLVSCIGAYPEMRKIDFALIRKL